MEQIYSKDTVRWTIGEPYIVGDWTGHLDRTVVGYNLRDRGMKLFGMPETGSALSNRKYLNEIISLPSLQIFSQKC
jgi:hypothetical protein